MIMSGYDFLKSQVLSCRQKVDSVCDVVISSGRVFQTRGPATVNARSPTVERLTDGTIIVSILHCYSRRHESRSYSVPLNSRTIGSFSATAGLLVFRSIVCVTLCPLYTSQMQIRYRVLSFIRPMYCMLCENNMMMMNFTNF